MNLAFGTPGPFSSGTLDSMELIRKLLDAGADVNARMSRNGMRDGQRNRFNRLGATAFMLAAKVTDVEAMRLLLAAGADPTIPTADGTTSLMVAAGLHIWNRVRMAARLPGRNRRYSRPCGFVSKAATMSTRATTVARLPSTASVSAV
jgi:hypothetical protein